jgi:hypothetical protein
MLQPFAASRRSVVAASHRRGPLGRLARLILAIVFAATLWSIVGPDGSARFRNAHILTEPSAWLLHALMASIYILLIGALAQAVWGVPSVRRAQLIAAAVLGSSLGSAGLIGQFVYGAAWGFPLADLVWWFDVGMLAEQVAALVLAIVLGTPGCEIGVWPELIARRRGARSSTVDGLGCIVGLHLLDRWECIAIPVAERRRLIPNRRAARFSRDATAD